MWFVPLSSFLKCLYQVFSVLILAHFGKGGKQSVAAPAPVGGYSDCRLGLSNFLQSGHGDAEPQTSGVF